MDKTAHYSAQSVLREPRNTETSNDDKSETWPVWLKSWFFIISSLALWAGIYLAVTTIL